jgi:FkbM family methyltransferase
MDYKLKTQSSVTYPYQIGSKMSEITIHYNLIPSHIEHAPMKATAKGNIWERKLYNIYHDILNKPQNNDKSAIDVGAYIGTHTLPMGLIAGGHVFAFEANPDIFDTLKKNVEQLGLETISVSNQLISQHEDELLFYNRSDGTSRISDRHIKNDYHSYRETKPLDKCIPDFYKDDIALIKIDVEGHELQVLKGAKEIIEKSRPIILIEVFKHKLKHILEWTELNDYDITKLGGEDFQLTPRSTTLPPDSH